MDEYYDFYNPPQEDTSAYDFYNPPAQDAYQQPQEPIYEAPRTPWYTQPEYTGEVAPGGSTEQIYGQPGWLGGAVQDIDTFLNTKSGQAGVTAISGLLSRFFASKDAKEKMGLKQQMSDTVTRQGWAPDLVNKFMSSLDTYAAYRAQMPAPGMTPEQQDYWNQQMAYMNQYGALPGDIAARGGLEQAYGAALPYQQYARSQALMSEYLNKQEAQTAKEMQQKYGQMVGTSTGHGLALESMLREDQAARLAALQNASQMEQAYGGMFTTGAGQAANIAGQIGRTYPGIGNIGQYLGFAGAPKEVTTSDIIKAQGVYGPESGYAAQGFGAAMQPSTTTSIRQLAGYDPSKNWLSQGIAESLKSMGQTGATKMATETQEQYNKRTGVTS